MFGIAGFWSKCSRPSVNIKRCTLFLLAGLVCLLAGCGAGIHGVGVVATNGKLKGNLHGGQQPVTNSSIQLYAMSTQGDGAASTPLLSSPVLTDINGDFNIDTFTCPSPASQLYIVSAAGNPGLSAGSNNPNLAEMALLGPCSAITESTRVVINEITTIAAVYALSPFMKSYREIGSASGDQQQLGEAMTAANEMANFGTGGTPGSALPAGQTAPVQKLQTLANIVAACVNSLGGTASDGSLCGNLFLYATAGSTAPANTIDAVLRIAQNPESNVAQIFSLSGWAGPFQPSLSAAPADWRLSLTSSVPAPSFLPAPGEYSSPQTATVSDTNASAQIYYTTDGSLPTTSSTLYSGPMTVSVSTTIRAIAIAGGLSSVASQGKYAITTNPSVDVALAPSTVTLSASATQQFTTQVSGTSNTAVTWQITPAVGSISPAGLYTAPASVSSAQLVSLTATSVADSTKTATVTMMLMPAPASHATYYLSATGSDANSGTSASSPWLTPNHPLNCGDVILAAVSTAYSYTNFQPTKWGRVTCPGNNNVAWLKCAVFDQCKIQIPASNMQAQGIYVGASYWGIQGWEVSNLSTAPDSLGCFATFPSTATLHHIIFANNVASTCPLSGFSAGINGRYSTDYLIIVGNISYKGGTYNNGCGANIDIYKPQAADTAAGTHIYIAGNLTYGATNPPSPGNSCFDGEGIILDTLDGKGPYPQDPNDPTPYAQQIVVENNIAIFNGGPGLLVEYSGQADYTSNYTGPAPAVSNFAPIYVRHNTIYGNSTGVASNGGSYAYGSGDCGEFRAYDIDNVSFTGNLAATNQAGCYGFVWQPNYVLSVVAANNVSDATNWAYSASGYNGKLANASPFAYNTSDTFGNNPQFANPTQPGVPNCSAYSSVPACMANVVANFTPQNAGARSYGYQMPSAPAAYDPLFPQWLCSVDLPANLVTMRCSTTGSSAQTRTKAVSPVH